MELNNNEAAVRAELLNADPDSTVAVEIDLYDDLIAFVELSPEEQSRQADRSEGIPAPDATGQAFFRHAGTQTPTLEQVEVETAEPTSGSSYDHSKEPSEAANARPDLIELFGPSGPLAGPSAEYPFTGALSRGVCIACGAESGADDLFCITCGDFLDEVASALPFNPNCPDCGLAIGADEVFCPWCGSVLPAA